MNCYWAIIFQLSGLSEPTGLVIVVLSNFHKGAIDVFCCSVQYMLLPAFIVTYMNKWL